MFDSEIKLQECSTGSPTAGCTGPCPGGSLLLFHNLIKVSCNIGINRAMTV